MHVVFSARLQPGTIRSSAILATGRLVSNAYRLRHQSGLEIRDRSRRNEPQRLTLPNVISSVHSTYGRIDAAYSAISPCTGLGTTVVPNFNYQNYVFTADGKGVRPFVPGAISSGSGGTQSMSGGPEFESRHPRLRRGSLRQGSQRALGVSSASGYNATDRLRLFT